jgi:hypothetical protein
MKILKLTQTFCHGIVKGNICYYYILLIHVIFIPEELHCIYNGEEMSKQVHYLRTVNISNPNHADPSVKQHPLHRQLHMFMKRAQAFRIQ